MRAMIPTLSCGQGQASYCGAWVVLEWERCSQRHIANICSKRPRNGPMSAVVSQACHSRPWTIRWQAKIERAVAATATALLAARYGPSI